MKSCRSGHSIRKTGEATLKSGGGDTVPVQVGVPLLVRVRLALGMRDEAGAAVEGMPLGTAVRGATATLFVERLSVRVLVHVPKLLLEVSPPHEGVTETVVVPEKVDVKPEILCDITEVLRLVLPVNVTLLGVAVVGDAERVEVNPDTDIIEGLMLVLGVNVTLLGVAVVVPEGVEVSPERVCRDGVMLMLPVAVEVPVKVSELEAGLKETVAIPERLELRSDTEKDGERVPLRDTEGVTVGDGEGVQVAHFTSAADPIHRRDGPTEAGGRSQKHPCLRSVQRRS